MTLTYYKGTDGDYITGPGGCQRVWVVTVGEITDGNTQVDLLLCRTRAERRCGDLNLCAEHAAEWLATARAAQNTYVDELDLELPEK